MGDIADWITEQGQYDYYENHDGFEQEREVSVFKGFVKKLSVKEGTGKRGKWKLYSAKLEKEDGSEYDEWISFGFDAPNCKEGDYVKITAEKNDRGYWQASETKRLKNAPARASSSSTSSGESGVGSGGGKTQQFIHYQNSRTAAIEVLKLLQSQDALPLSSAKTKAGEAKRYEEIMALVNKITVQFYFDLETQRLLESVVDAGAVEKDSGKLPDDTDVDEEEEADDEDDSDEEEADDDEEDDEE